MAASSKNATVQIFPRQTPVKNATARLHLVEDTCEGALHDLIPFVSVFLSPQLLLFLLTAHILLKSIIRELIDVR